MTIKKFFLVTLAQWLLMTLLKVWFFGYLHLNNQNLQYVMFWILTVVVIAILVKRLGILNYLEAIFVGIFWMLEGALADLVITSVFVGLGIFGYWQFWVGYGLVGVVVFLCHTKRHIAVRKGIPVPGEHHH